MPRHARTCLKPEVEILDYQIGAIENRYLPFKNGLEQDL